jgi:hypothetical protein
MTDASQGPPEKGKGAEIIVKRNLGLSIGLFSESELDLREGIAIFANREGYQFLAEYFRWLAQRSVAENESDLGDHVHLTPHSDCCDEIDFTFDTLTTTNRDVLLTNAQATITARRRGSPIKQFSGIVADLIATFEGYLKGGELRESTIVEINELMVVLDEQLNKIKRLAE